MSFFVAELPAFDEPAVLILRICPELDTEYTFPGSQVIETGLAAARAAAGAFVAGAEVAGADVAACAGAAGMSTTPVPVRTMTNAVNAAQVERMCNRASAIDSSFRFQTISLVWPHVPVRAHGSVQAADRQGI
ncbi:hypothetical protein [Brevibacterium sp. ZH18]|uniref:hypothetical protein n=1 Tax=Brevibacterium sp. ZH18 TaxID=2927784 RepID=UPI001F60576B|nr:hypothetical protein [Brevibacterium sp. ZH18]MCI4011387.1 hypothetical protein [Brevibacterium sp. ZH18]